MDEISMFISTLWKTIPGRLKQVPQDSPEWDRMDTRHCTFTLTRVILILTHFLNPLNWKLLYAFHSCFITPFICPTVHLFFYLSAILSVNQSVSLYICFPIYLFPYISVRLSFCSSHLVIYRLSRFLSFYLSVCLSICIFLNT